MKKSIPASPIVMRNVQAYSSTRRNQPLRRQRHGAQGVGQPLPTLRRAPGHAALGRVPGNATPTPARDKALMRGSTGHMGAGVLRAKCNDTYITSCTGPRLGLVSTGHPPRPAYDRTVCQPPTVRAERGCGENSRWLSDCASRALKGEQMTRVGVPGSVLGGSAGTGQEEHFGTWR